MDTKGVIMSDKALLAGELRLIGLPDLLQILGGKDSTGILHITSQYDPTPGFIHFVNGDPVNAKCGNLVGIDAIYAMFGWIEGRFEFFQQAVQVEHVVKNSLMEITLEGLKMLDKGIIKKVGPMPSDNVPAVLKYVGGDTLPVIKGPLVNYMYVIDEEEFRDGERIVEEGAHGTWIWVILQGVVKITRQTANDPFTLARLGEGATIGTITSLSWHGHVRSATATAVGNVHLGVLDRGRLAEEHASLSPEFERLLLSLDDRLIQITDTLIDLSMKEIKPDGSIGNKEIIIREGFPREEVFTITQGEAYMIQRTPQGYLSLLTLQEGDVFGYVPFMDIGHEFRSVSVVASKDLKVHRFNIDSIRKEYNRLSPAFKGLIANTATFVSLTTRLAGQANLVCSIVDSK